MNMHIRGMHPLEIYLTGWFKIEVKSDLVRSRCRSNLKEQYKECCAKWDKCERKWNKLFKVFSLFSWFKHEYRIFLISFELNFVRCVLQILSKRKRNTIDYNSILS